VGTYIFQWVSRPPSPRFGWHR